MSPPPPSRTSFVSLPAAAASLLLASCGGDGDEPAAAAPPGAAPATRVLVAEVEAMEFFESAEALGTVRAREAIEISPTVTERIEEVFFEDGDRVERGALLVRLADAEQRASLAAAEAELAEHEREIARIESLVAEGAVSRVRLEETETRRDIAAQRVEEGRARVEERSIVAPFDGVLGFRRVSPGALVGPADTIATLDLLDPVRLDFPVPETFLPDLAPGLRIEAYSAAYPGEAFDGEVTQIDSRVDPATRSVTVRAEIPNADHRLRPGMLMTTTLARNPRRSPAIPERAVVPVQARQFVFVVEEDAEGRTAASRREVELGQRSPGYVEVLDGVEEGLLVVSDGVLGLQDGAAVEVAGEFEGPAAPYSP